jgi:hypothetical protein
MYTLPTVADFKAYFPNNFPYGNNAGEVSDLQIQQAIDEMGIQINQSLFLSQASFNISAEYLSAHYLVMNLTAAGSGCSGQEQWLIQSKSVGSISTSFAIPQRILDNPYFAWLSKTTYGNRYLMNVFPLLSGQIFITRGATQP